MSKWQEDRARANQLALARLEKSLPPAFPAAVLARALACRFIPPTPRLAVDGYWRDHPLRADRLARALAGRSGAPEGWRWRLADDRAEGLPATFRSPPAPYREAAHAKGPGFCCVCGQGVYRFGWHVDLWDRDINKNANWHSACVVAWQFWNAPSGEAKLLRRLQSRRCRQSSGRLWRTAEVDHRVPLFQVWRQHRDAPWPELLGYWGLPNLQVINREVHVEKCATEARDRSLARGAAAEIA
ncbi:MULTISPECIES: hypothetical protein [Rhodopseudomonas]|uniref:Uncharacterized protein n=1 Tax=Rhodopseudomonas palustris TaxID=1076 RepID=A0A0D7ERJ0_RHOPL|nr:MULTISPECIES: hypothetical protein [Rhodopseudomonas]KIZ43439.1 hypothetical protein OO17_11295 [Rhodopseudomonas palustris]MDF3810193.1 hypothetical protein [Rhodopseudomonas sp. BAL398]WOK20178.1 hypothetical protein RBJ75_11960 [Rhodopseudomonas sp. BAL398]